MPRKRRMGRGISTVAITKGLVFCPDFAGCLRCMDAETGQLYWSHDLEAAIWSSPLACDGKVFIADDDGDVVVMAADKTEKPIATNASGESIESTPVFVNGIMYVLTRDHLLAIREKH